MLSPLHQVQASEEVERLGRQLEGAAGEVSALAKAADLKEDLEKSLSHVEKQKFALERELAFAKDEVALEAKVEKIPQKRRENVSE